MLPQNKEVSKEEIFLATLREQTRSAHQSIEMLPLPARIIQPDVTIQEYYQYLKLMFTLHKDVEQLVYPLLTDIIPDIDKRKKSHYIENDLATAGYTTPLLNNPPFTGRMPQMSHAFALGIMYVMEGSTLGGRVILKNIQASLPQTQMHSNTFLEGYGINTGSTWNSFLSLLKSYPKSQTDEQEIIAGANFAFGIIHEYMQQ